MTGGKAGICFRSGTEECQRAAAVRTAREAITNPFALIALRLYDKASSQWRATMGERFGLDYVAVFGLADRIGIEVDAEVLEYLQVLEAEQVDAWKPAE